MPLAYPLLRAHPLCAVIFTLTSFIISQLEDSHERLEQENQHLKERLKRLKAELVTLEKENEDLVGQLEGLVVIGIVT
mgnify:CR=1 FL=1